MSSLIFLATCVVSLGATADLALPSLPQKNPLDERGVGSGNPLQTFSMKCTPFVKRDGGGDYNVTLSQYLGTYVGCSSSVSKGLKEIFINSEQSAKVRNELRGSLGNVCALYVGVFSRLARMNQSSAMCDSGALQDVVIDQDFCEKIDPDSASVDSTLSSLDALGYSNYSSALSALVGLSGAACTSKCGSQSGKILCNAYFSMATVLVTVVAQEVAGKISICLSTARNETSAIINNYDHSIENQ